MFLTGLLWTSSPAIAQQLPAGDSLYHYSIPYNAVQRQFLNITSLVADSSFKEIGILQADFQQQKGAYHTAQQPYQSRIATLYTEGIKQLDKFRVAGRFRINRQWDDSLANNLNGIFDDAAPYTYFATKAAKYERQNYVFNALAAYHAGSKIDVGLGLDYNYHWTTGSVDPRPSVKELNYIFKPELTWKAGRHRLGIQGDIGRGNETSNIKYKNANFGLSLLYPERIYYLNYGYGYISIKDQSINQRDQKYSGLHINHDWSSARWRINSTLYYQRKKEYNKREREVDTRPNLGIFSTWTLHDYGADVFIVKKSSVGVQQLIVKGLIQDGFDWDSTFNANNYQYHHHRISAGYTIQLSRQQPLGWEYGVGVLYDNVEKKDLLQAHHVQYSYLQPNVHIGAYCTWDKTERLAAKLTPSMRFPLETYISVPSTQENIFTQHIVYPDYYYWSSRVFQCSLELNYISGKILKTTPAGLFGRCAFSRQLDVSTKVLNTAYQPGKDLFDIQFGFRIYL
ncbi:MAG: hypothetical protein QM610_14780 [Chitinophagaceae bacterium]